MISLLLALVACGDDKEDTAPSEEVAEESEEVVEE